MGNLPEAVRTANDESAAALKSGNLAAFALAAHMAPDYHEVSADGRLDMSQDDILRRERALLAGNRYTDIETGVTSVALTGPNTATVTLWRRAIYVSIGPPPSFIQTPQGTRIINHTQRFTHTQLLEQVWQRDKEAWLVSRCRIVRDATVGVS